MIPGHGGISRRSVLKMMAAAGATTVAASQWPRAASSASRLVVGAAYVGPKDDYGWNQGHAQGVTAVKKIDGVKVVEEENVPETVQVQKTMESMISLDGASLIFATSFGHWEHMLKVRMEFRGMTPPNSGGRNLISWHSHALWGQAGAWPRLPI